MEKMRIVVYLFLALAVGLGGYLGFLSGNVIYKMKGVLRKKEERSLFAVIFLVTTFFAVVSFVMPHPSFDAKPDAEKAISSCFAAGVIVGALFSFFKRETKKEDERKKREVE